MNGAYLSLVAVVVFCGLVFDPMAFVFTGSAVAMLVVKGGA